MESLLNGWMDGCTDRWVVDGLMDDRMDGLMVEYMDDCFEDEWMLMGV
jgi:hypothetical protein